MNKHATRLAAVMLDRYADDLGNAGCNDLDLTTLVPDKDDRDAMVSGWCEADSRPEDYRDHDGDGPDYRMNDWELALWLVEEMGGKGDD